VVVDATAWIKQFAEALGTEPPSEDDWTALLSLASAAAKGSERLAAPISCWLVARSGRTPSEALGLAREVLAGQAESR
jgi:hypothetical protein